MRIAILGAGGVGVCAALELAQRGYHVDLYDENPQVLTRASYNNEGKIHLGLVYAKDASLKTAETMIRGAVHFTSRLARWIDVNSDRLIVSTPYYYAVHKETMTGVAELEQHYGRCKTLFDAACSSPGVWYLNGERTLVAEKLSRAEMEHVIDGDSFLAVFRTSERAVDPRGIAVLLREAVEANPRIRVIANAHVTSAAWDDSGQVRCCFRLDGEEYTEAYDQMASTLWHGRLAIDASLGLMPASGWIFRYKLGGRINSTAAPGAVPSLTIVLGPFGDIVNLGVGGVYFSWYPIGMIGTSRDLKPPDWDRSVPLADRQDVLRRSSKSWGCCARPCDQSITLRAPILAAESSSHGVTRTFITTTADCTRDTRSGFTR